MKVLTIRQPYAEMIKEGIKKYEIRSRKTNYRGELYIHSSLAKINKNSNKNLFLGLLENKDLKYGYILCQCNLKDCIYINKEFLKTMNKDAPKNLYKDDCIGYYAWIISDVVLLTKPIAAKGQLGIWNLNS